MFLLTYLILQYIKQITIFLTEIDKQTASDIWVTINIVSVYFSVALNNELLKETTLEYPSTLQISRRHFVLEPCSAGFSFSGGSSFSAVPALTISMLIVTMARKERSQR